MKMELNLLLEIASELSVYTGINQKKEEYMTPEQKEEFDDMAINCLSNIIESNTGVKPEIEKEGDFIKVTTEEPTIN